ncbi:hypothetical protein C8J57DRAFT_1381371 [Mycena rebaudengoi]|nr:hypothetical protein C8J57DRAFT_1381371 [Mycena rebaudengoi]
MALSTPLLALWGYSLLTLVPNVHQPQPLSAIHKDPTLVQTSRLNNLHHLRLSPDSCARRRYRLSLSHPTSAQSTRSGSFLLCGWCLLLRPQAPFSGRCGIHYLRPRAPMC